MTLGSHRVKTASRQPLESQTGAKDCFLLVAIVWAVTSCAPPESALDKSADDGPNVLLITVDTLRADHLGLYGYHRPTSPNIDRWFSDTWIFDRAYAPEASTPPSIVSILTGKLPQNHRVRLFYQLLPDEVRTLSGHFRRGGGYQSAAVVSNMVLTNEAVGLGDRFDYYDDYVDERESKRPVWARTARRTTDAALVWLEEHRSKEDPHFLWVHYIDPHGPYQPPSDAPRRFTHEGFHPIDVDRIQPYQRDPDVTDALDYVDRYDEEIAYCDREIGRLLDAYAGMGLADEAIIVFTADHGETMIEHEYWFTHTYDVHEPIVRVPLALRVPRSLVENDMPPARAQTSRFVSRQIAHPVSLIDLAPTLLELAGIDRPEGFDGRSWVSDPRPRDVFTEATEFEGRWQRRAMLSGRGKWILTVQRATGAVVDRKRYRIDQDPGEKEPIEWSPADERAAEPLLTLTRIDPDPGGAPEHIDRGERLKTPKVAPGVSPEVIEKLRSLGYVE
jgi:arylsulfatase A-like enzyme